MEEKKDIKTSNEELKENFKKIEDEWSKTVRNLSSRLSCDAKEIVELQAEIISQRQILCDSLSEIIYSVYKILPKYKLLKKNRFEYYTLEYQIKKMSGIEKYKLIEADLAFYEQLVKIYENHIEHIKETLKNMDNLNYAVKNKIELYNVMGGVD